MGLGAKRLETQWSVLIDISPGFQTWIFSILPGAFALQLMSGKMFILESTSDIGKDAMLANPLWCSSKAVSSTYIIWFTPKVYRIKRLWGKIHNLLARDSRRQEDFGKLLLKQRRVICATSRHLGRSYQGAHLYIPGAHKMLTFLHTHTFWLKNA